MNETLCQNIRAVRRKTHEMKGNRAIVMTRTWRYKIYVNEFEFILVK